MKKILVPNSVPTQPKLENSKKKIAKKLKKLKSLFQHYVYAKRVEGDREREKRNLVPNSVHTRPAQESSERNRKKFKKLKNPFLALFLAKTG